MLIPDGLFQHLFNSHPLKEDDVDAELKEYMQTVFQLSSSQGG